MTYKDIIAKYGLDIRQAAMRYSLKDTLLAALIMTESSGRMDAVGDANYNGEVDPGDAYGITQLRQCAIDDYNEAHSTKWTYRDVAKDPRLALEISGWYLRAKIKEWEGDLILGVRAYNQGTGTVRKNPKTAGLDYAMKIFYHQVVFTEIYLGNKSTPK